MQYAYYVYIVDATHKYSTTQSLSSILVRAILSTLIFFACVENLSISTHNTCKSSAQCVMSAYITIY